MCCVGHCMSIKIACCSNCWYIGEISIASRHGDHGRSVFQHWISQSDQPNRNNRFSDLGSHSYRSWIPNSLLFIISFSLYGHSPIKKLFPYCELDLVRLIVDRHSPILRLVYSKNFTNEWVLLETGTVLFQKILHSPRTHRTSPMREFWNAPRNEVKSSSVLRNLSSISATFSTKMLWIDFYPTWFFSLNFLILHHYHMQSSVILQKPYPLQDTILPILRLPHISETPQRCLAISEMEFASTTRYYYIS